MADSTCTDEGCPPVTDATCRSRRANHNNHLHGILTMSDMTSFPPLASPYDLTQAASAYATDAWQRTVLYADVRRRRGDQYRAHMEEDAPNVLDFPCEQVISGFDLPRPVNYGMVRIMPTEGLSVDEQ